MGGKSLDQRIADVEVRIRQYESKKQVLERQMREKERKERTRRLIQIGGIMARLGVDTLEKAQALQREVESRPEVTAWLNTVAARSADDR